MQHTFQQTRIRCINSLSNCFGLRNGVPSRESRKPLAAKPIRAWWAAEVVGAPGRAPLGGGACRKEQDQPMKILGSPPPGLIGPTFGPKTGQLCGTRQGQLASLGSMRPSEPEGQIMRGGSNKQGGYLQLRSSRNGEADCLEREPPHPAEDGGCRRCTRGHRAGEGAWRGRRGQVGRS